MTLKNGRPTGALLWDGCAYCAKSTQEEWFTQLKYLRTRRGRVDETRCGRSHSAGHMQRSPAEPLGGGILFSWSQHFRLPCCEAEWHPEVGWEGHTQGEEKWGCASRFPLVPTVTSSVNEAHISPYLCKYQAAIWQSQYLPEDWCKSPGYLPGHSQMNSASLLTDETWFPSCCARSNWTCRIPEVPGGSLQKPMLLDQHSNCITNTSICTSLHVLT